MRCLVFYIVLFRVSLSSSRLAAQAINWPNPEVETLYKSAQASLSSGAFQQAIASYQQAISLAPDLPILYRDLGNAYYRAGRYEIAAKTVEPLIATNRADMFTYSLASSIQSALKNEKQARKYLDRGLEQYPKSGYLYYENGKYYEGQKEESKALANWLQGINREPGYALNYYAAAQSYLLSRKPIWALFYGEIFVNLERNTPRSQEARKLLIAAYRKFFSSTEIVSVPKFGKKQQELSPGNFEAAARSVLIKLAPILADGMNTENLIMLRTRFAMEWMAGYQQKFPVSLFAYWDDLLQQGYFDAYNQWLFGKADNAAQFESWIKFHPKAIPEYEAYYSLHPLMPSGISEYNGGVGKDLFESGVGKNKR